MGTPRLHLRMNRGGIGGQTASLPRLPGKVEPDRGAVPLRMGTPEPPPPHERERNRRPDRFPSPLAGEGGAGPRSGPAPEGDPQTPPPHERGGVTSPRAYPWLS